MAGGWALLCIGSDGSTRSSHRIRDEVTEIGRAASHLAFPDDEFMASHHASLVFEAGEPFVADTAKGNGVWLRVTDPEGLVLEDESQVCLGSQILVAERREGLWQLVHYGADASRRGAHAVGESGITAGRNADLSLDAEDEVLSRHHARFRFRDGELVVCDCGSRNGTWVKIRGAAPLGDGDEFRIETRGFRLVRVEG